MDQIPFLQTENVLERKKEVDDRYI